MFLTFLTLRATFGHLVNSYKFVNSLRALRVLGLLETARFKLQ